MVLYVLKKGNSTYLDKFLDFTSLSSETRFFHDEECARNFYIANRNQLPFGVIPARIVVIDSEELGVGV